MRRNRLCAAVLAALMMALCLGGCWDRRELEEIAFVLAMGIDSASPGLYQITMVIAIPAKMYGGAPGGQSVGSAKPYMLITAQAPTLSSAVKVIDSVVDRQISLIHTRVLFMGEELARKGGLTIVDEIARLRETRRAMIYIVTKEPAADFLKQIELDLEKEPNRFIEQMTYSYLTMGSIPGKSQVHDFIAAVSSGYSDPLTYYATLRKPHAETTQERAAPQGGQSPNAERFEAGKLPLSGDGPNIEMTGAAAFRRAKMVGVLSGNETDLALMLQGNFRRGVLTFSDPKREGQFVSLTLLEGRPTITHVDLRDAHPQIEVTVTLEAELLAVTSDIDWTRPDLQAVLEAHVSHQLAGDAGALIAKTQQWDADVIGFGNHVVRRFPTIASWLRYDWPHPYKEAEVHVQFRVTMRRFGLKLGSLQTMHQ